MSVQVDPNTSSVKSGLQCFSI